MFALYKPRQGGVKLQVSGERVECAKGGFGGSVMVVQLHLPAGRLAHRVFTPTSRTSQTPLPELASVAGLSREAEQLYGTVPSVAGHAVVRRGHSRWTRYAPLAAIGPKIDLELVLTEVL